MGSVVGSSSYKYTVAELEKILSQVKRQCPDIFEGMGSKLDANVDFTALRNEKSQWNETRLRQSAHGLGANFSKNRWNVLMEMVKHVRG